MHLLTNLLTKKYVRFRIYDVRLWLTVFYFSSILNLHGQTQNTDSTKIKTDLVGAAFITNDSLKILTDTLGADSLKAGISNEIKSKVHYTATDTIDFDVDSEMVYMYNDAQVIYEDIELKAAYIEVNWNSKNVFSAGLRDTAGGIYGKPVFKQSNDAFKADTMRYNFDTKKGKVYNITTQQGEGYIHGEIVKKMDESSYIKFGKYTTCELDSPHYYIGANKLKVIPNNKIVTGPAYLVINDVPTPAAIPFGMFPNKKGRSSGIVFPTYGESTQLGFFLKNGGYYFGLGEHVDMELTGDIYSLGSWAAHAYSRYANRYHYNGSVAFNYSIIKQSEKELPDYSRSKEFFIRWNHSQDAKARPSSVFSANVNAGSSDYYQKNISSANNYLTNTFSSSISFSKTFKRGNITSAITHSQNSATKIVTLTAPSVGIGLNTIYPFMKKETQGTPRWYEKIGVSYSGNLQNQSQTPDSIFFKNEMLKRFRNGMQHTVPIATSLKVLKYFTLSPSFNYSENWYLETVRKNFVNDSLITDTVKGFRSARRYEASAGMSTRVYGMLNFRNSKIKAIRHVMSPSVSYSYHPDFGKKKFGYYKDVQTDTLGNISRYSIFEQTIFGGPTQGKSGTIGIGIDNNLEMKLAPKSDTTEARKIKIFESVSVSTSYNTAVDSFNWAPISLSARTTFFEKINLQGGANFDMYTRSYSGRRLNKLEINENNRLAHFTDGYMSVTFNLNQHKKNKQSNKATETELNDINKNLDNYVDFTVPYNFAVSYNLRYSKPFLNQEASVSQTASVNGDISLTEKWKVTFSSGYDFKQKDFTYSSLGFFRDLHCWEMHLMWVPFGAQANYFFQINVKASVLQDLKLVKKNDQYDR